MNSTPTLLSGFQTVFQLLGQVAFQWVPGMFQALAGTQTPSGVTYPTPPLGAPATVSDMGSYLQQLSAPGVYSALAHDWSVFVALSFFISLLCGALIIYCTVRVSQIRKHELLKLEAISHPVAAHDVPQTLLRWRRIESEISSESEQSWRVAILEADIMLNELLDVLGYRGETMADKMRAADRSQFHTIDKAWEAHRARNQVAHQGSGVPITQRDAQHIIALYRDVFKEFKFIE